MGDDSKGDIAQRYKPKTSLSHHLKWGSLLLMLSLVILGFSDLIEPAYIMWGAGDYEGSWSHHNLLTFSVIISFLGGINLGRAILNIVDEFGIYNSEKLTVKGNKDQIAYRLMWAGSLVALAWYFRGLNPIPILDEYVFMLFSGIIIGLAIDEFIHKVVVTSDEE